MAVTHTNRKGQTYYLCQGQTKTGRPRYYFAREPKGVSFNQIPDGYTIRESVNGVVSLTKVRPTLLREEEISTVKAAVQAHLEARHYRVDAKANQITVYEHAEPDLAEMTAHIAEQLGIPSALARTARERMQEQENRHAQFTPILRFNLTNEDKRLFAAQRMRFFGTDHWITIEYNKTIAELAAALIPTLGTDEFFELF